LGKFSQEGSYKENPLSRGEFWGEVLSRGELKRKSSLKRGVIPNF
jgi:hypothetical protein